MNIDLSETMLLRVHDPYTISQVSTLLRASAAKRFKCQPIRKNGRKPAGAFIAEWTCRARELLAVYTYYY